MILSEFLKSMMIIFHDEKKIDITVRLRLAMYGKYCRLMSTGLKSPSS
jgi:hypothetical protein